jgi:hypothetical protein
MVPRNHLEFDTTISEAANLVVLHSNIDGHNAQGAARGMLERDRCRRVYARLPNRDHVDKILDIGIKEGDIIIVFCPLSPGIRVD